MSLKTYNEKRDFRKTTEPTVQGARKPSKGAGGLYVVQKHDASRLHYDFRLEVEGVLKSWAVPKGPSEDPEVKRLAVQTEDHPLDYGDFEGVIPKDEYGGGTVMLWDWGEWEPEDENPAAALEAGKLSFTVRGEKLSGSWALVRMQGQRSDEGRNWLLIKHDDDVVDRRRKPAVEAKPDSVKTGRSLREIAEDEGDRWHVKKAARHDGGSGRGGGDGGTKATGSSKGSSESSKRSSASDGRGSRGGGGVSKREAKAVLSAERSASAEAGTKRGRSSKKLKLGDVEGAKAATTLREPRPSLCTLVGAAPEGDGWIHEIKVDGYRLLARKTASGARLVTRTGKDWTDRFGPVARAIESLRVEEAIIDGEACIVDDDGRTSFQGLQNAIKAERYGRLRLFAFDLLFLDGYDLTECSLLDRKRLLRGVIPSDEGEDATLRYTDHIVGGGAAVYEQACELGLEGVICKKADSRYTQKRTRSWLKVKCSKRQEFVIVGFTEPGGSRKHFGSLLLGAHDENGELVYAGKVGTGFSDATLRSIGGKLRSTERTTCPLSTEPGRSETKDARWVTPELVGEVEFTEWTSDGRLRHPAFQGLREDKEADAVRIERAESGSARGESGEKNGTGDAKDDRATKRSQAGGSSDAKNGRARIAGVSLSSPDRVLYPEQGLTKRDLAAYFAEHAEWILTYVADRPLSTVRCPSGRTGECFFQKHVRETFASEHITPIEVKESGETREYIGVHKVEGLVTLAQFGVLEIHPWGSKKDKLDKPDSVTFDLDPDEGLAFDDVKDAALMLRDLLDDLGLRSFVKTTGGKGLHVLAPLTRTSGWDEAKSFASDIAKGVAAGRPKKFVATMSKEKRRGKIFIDYLRNARGSTSVAAFSPRARAQAPVSTPLGWDELGSLDSPARYTVANVGRRLASLKGDPWADYHTARQSLTKERRERAKGVGEGGS